MNEPTECHHKRTEFTQLIGPPFNGSQCSQLFINCCFALSLSGVFLLVCEAFKNAANRYYIWWVPLAGYLIFTIWRQYSTYYIPVQHYRPTPESDSEELTTLLITLMLASFAPICMYLPQWALVYLGALVLLNLFKIRQMKHILNDAPKVPPNALFALQDFSKRLWCYFGILVLLIAIVFAFLSNLEPWLFAMLAGIAPLPLHFAARWLYRDFCKRRAQTTSLTAQAYIAEIAAAWPRGSPPRNSASLC
jgi:hypothetical protein